MADEIINPHKQALMETGFWGRAAAGGIIMARDTGRFLLAHRGEKTLEPGTWGTWGGACDGNETAQQTMRRELHEEAGFYGDYEIIELYVFRHQTGFTYTSFLVTTEVEFEPVLNWETQACDWFEYGCWPDPLHYGLRQIFDDNDSHALLQKALATR